MRRLQVGSLLIVVLALGLGGQHPQGQAGPSVPQAVTEALARDGRALVIVGMESQAVPEGLLATAAEVQQQRDLLHAALDDTMARAAAVGVTSTRRFETIPYFTAAVDNPGSLAALAALPGVVSITEDGLLDPDLIDSVPLINAPAAWAAGATGAGWKVAVLDTGVQASHPFFGGRVTGEACFSDANGASFTGTSLCPGGAPTQIGPGAAMDCELSTSGCGHGTHVAGIAAGANGTGTLAGHSGVAPGVQVLAVQVFTRFTEAASCGTSPTPCARSFFSDLIRGLEWVHEMSGPGNANRVAAANMSLGGGTFTDQPTCDAQMAPLKRIIDQLRSIGVASVFSAGNAGLTNALGAPGCVSSAVSVGSTTKTDAISSFSNRASFLTLMAPGSDIRSSTVGIGSTSGVLSGTSMAAPHVAGAWAVLKQAAPGASVANIVAALRLTGTIIPDGALTHYRINVNAARLSLLSLSGAPGAPGTPVITGSGNQITITVPAPTTGGLPTSYTILARLAPGGPIVATLPLGLANQVSVTAPNGTFFVTAQASNAAGSSPESAGTTFAVPFVPAPPGPPTFLSVHFAGREVHFSWAPSGTGGAVASYILQAALTAGGPAVASVPVAGTSLVVLNVPPGTYFVRVLAVNAGGVSAPSPEQTFTVPATNIAPGTPTLLPVTASGNQVTMQWYPAYNGGFPTAYTIRASLTSGGPTVATLTSTSTTVTVPAPAGTYFITVTANNAHGSSGPSNQRSITVP